MSGRITSDGERFINGRVLAGVGLTARGSMKLTGLPKPLERKRSARWAAVMSTSQRGSDADARLAFEGYLLIDFGRGDRVCLSGRIAGSLDEPFATGKVTGTIDLPRTRTVRHLPKPCRTAARALR